MIKSFLVGLKSNDKCPCKIKAKGDYKDSWGGGNVNAEADNEIAQPQVKQCQQPPEARKCKERYLP